MRLDGLTPASIDPRAYGAVGDGVTDDSVAFQQALAAALAGPKRIVVPPGRYLIPDGLALGAAHDLTIIGRGASLVATTAGAPALYTFAPTDTDTHFASDPSITWLPLDDGTAPFLRGAMSVTLDDSGDASSLAPGDVVWIRARGLVSGNEAITPVAELNVVVSLSGATVNLQYPLAKDYDFDSNWTFGIGRATSYCRNLTVEGLTLENVTQRAACILQVLGCRLTDIRAVGSSGIHVRGRFMILDGCRVQIDPDWSSGFRPYVLAVDTGSSDVTIRGFESKSTAAGIVHLHEACADLEMQGRVVNGATDSDTAEEWGVLSVRALSWDVRLAVDVHNSPRGAALNSHDSSLYPGEGNEGLVWQGRFSGEALSGFSMVSRTGLAIDTTGALRSM